jgi:hypothetical protein
VVSRSTRMHMTKVPHSTDLWVLTVRMRGIDVAIIDAGYDVAEEEDEDSRALRHEIPSDAWDSGLEWYGPQVRRSRKVEALAGRCAKVSIMSEILGQRRELIVYVPPQPPLSADYPVIYMADALARRYAPYLEGLLVAGLVEPVLLVGIVPGVQSGRYLRNLELLPYGDREHYSRHERFWIEEVLPFCEHVFHAASTRSMRAIMGCSAGGEFATRLQWRYPAVFGAIFCFGFTPVTQWHRPARPADHYVVSGTFELTPELRRLRRGWVTALRSGGGRLRAVTRVSGHHDVMWREEFPRAVRWWRGRR